MALGGWWGTVQGHVEGDPRLQARVWGLAGVWGALVLSFASGGRSRRGYGSGRGSAAMTGGGISCQAWV